MIKGIVTVCGTVYRQAALRTNKQGESYTSLTLKVAIPSNVGGKKDCWIIVNKDGDAMTQLGECKEGTRLSVKGVLTFRRDSEKNTTYQNLSASEIQIVDSSESDSLVGELEFNGTIGKDVICKNDKKGNPFVSFSAYSSDLSNNKERNYTWIRFVKFSGEKEEILFKGSKIHVTGSLDVEYYNDKITLSCIYTSVTPWERKM